jgi:hypothetical protein
MIDATLLNSYVGKNIKDICLFGFTDDSKNHCAHFVSHALNLDFGYTCKGSANLRVHEIFQRCPVAYEFNSCPSVVSGLIFVSQYRNFDSTRQTMRNVPKKHIGIIYNGNIWHYSNKSSNEKVIVQQMVHFIDHYRRQRNALWFGEIPDGARPHPWGVSV